MSIFDKYLVHTFLKSETVTEAIPTATWSENFAVSLGDFTTSGDVVWSRVTDEGNGDLFSAKSGNISHGEISVLQLIKVTTQESTLLKYDYKTSTEEGFDFLHVIVNGVIVRRYTGTNGWTSDQVYIHGIGSNTIKFVYFKDGSADGGTDEVWVDNVGLYNVEEAAISNTQTKFNESVTFMDDLIIKGNITLNAPDINGDLSMFNPEGYKTVRLTNKSGGSVFQQYAPGEPSPGTSMITTSTSTGIGILKPSTGTELAKLGSSIGGALDDGFFFASQLGFQFRLGEFAGSDATKILVVNGQSLFRDEVESTAFVTTSGTASQFVKGNGTLDNNTYLTSFTETDPIFQAHVSSGIVAQDITNWYTAFGWGNHATQGYLTSETDSQTLSFGFSTGQLTISNGNTISLDGRYLQSFDITTQTDAKYLRSDVADTALGAITFNNGTTHISDINLNENVKVVFDIDGDDFNSIVYDSTASAMTYYSTGNHIFKNGEDDGYETLVATGYSTFGGTSSQFLKANGTLDSNTYLLDTTDTLTGTLTVTTAVNNDTYNAENGGHIVSKWGTSGVKIGLNDGLAIGAGEWYGQLVGNQPSATEVVSIGSENGLNIYSNTGSNVANWATRHTITMNANTFTYGGFDIYHEGNAQFLSRKVSVAVSPGSTTNTWVKVAQVVGSAFKGTGGTYEIVGGSDYGGSAIINWNIRWSSDGTMAVDSNSWMRIMSRSNNGSSYGSVPTSVKMVSNGSFTAELWVKNTGNYKRACTWVRSETVDGTFTYFDGFTPTTTEPTGTSSFFGSWPSKSALDVRIESSSNTYPLIVQNSLTATNSWTGIQFRVGTSDYGNIEVKNTGGYGNMTFRTRSTSSDVERIKIWGQQNTVSIGFQSVAPTDKLQVNGTGKFTSTVTATNFILSSDKRLKHKIKDVDYDDYIKMDVKTYELKSEKGVKRTGVIAQELEVNHPEFVRTDSEGMKSVAYTDLLMAKIAELEARLEKLEK